jgi:ferritin-like metal-binding protein YciE
MSQSEQKIVQHLNEAHAAEVSLLSALQSQIAMTPRGSYRTGLEKHLRRTPNASRRGWLSSLPRAAIRCWPGSGSWRAR